MGQKKTAITATGKNRITIYRPKTVLFAALLILGGCTREEATASLRADLQGALVAAGFSDRSSRCSCLFGKRNPASKCVPTLAGISGPLMYGFGGD